MFAFASIPQIQVQGKFAQIPLILLAAYWLSFSALGPFAALDAFEHVLPAPLSAFFQGETAAA